MTRLLGYTAIFFMLLAGPGVYAQDEGTGTSAPTVPAGIEGTWITQSGNIVEITLEGTDVALYFPAYARNMEATFFNGVLTYITHYRDPMAEECYIEPSDADYELCRKLIQVGEPRHRFILTLSEDGTVLSGTKETNVLQVEWDVDENGNKVNYRPVGYVFRYFSDYRWRRSNCDFSDLPPLNGNVLERYDLVGLLLDRYGLSAEFNLDDFDVRSRVRFVYEQAYLDADTGIFVPAEAAMVHPHIEPLNGRVILDGESGEYVIELYPYSFESYVNILSGLSMLCFQVNALESLDETPAGPSTQVESDSVGYAWSHRQALCALGDDEFNHHIDFLSRALEYRLMNEG